MPAAGAVLATYATLGQTMACASLVPTSPTPAVTRLQPPLANEEPQVPLAADVNLGAPAKKNGFGELEKWIR